MPDGHNRPVLTAMADSGSETGWVGIWAAAPQRTEPDNLPPPPFTRDGTVLRDSTLRQTIRVTADATRVRLRLSNAFGGTELGIARVYLARPGGGRAGVSAIEPGTSRAVTFAGRPGVTMPPGAAAVSDPVDFPVTAGANVAVTLYLPAGQPAAGGITSHPGSRTTSYLAAGDHVTATELTGAGGPVSGNTGSAEIEHWYFLSGVDAAAGPAGPTGAAVFLGDSLTDGRGSTTNGNDRWPDQLLDLMRSRGDGGAGYAGSAALLNQGIGGNRVLRDGLGPAVLARLHRDVLAVSGVRWLVVFAGVNDIGTAEATLAAQAQVAAELGAAYEQIAAMMHAAGIACYAATLTPFGGSASYDDPGGHREYARRRVNARIRSRRRRYGAVLDFEAAVADFDAADRGPLAPRRLRAEFDTGDGLHLNPAGYRALANAVPFGLFT
jgi:lysophospholipase L1-like esterase